MADEDTTLAGGRITLAIAGSIGLLIGVGTLHAAVAYPSAVGIGAYAGGGVFGLGGLAAIIVAVIDPEGLDISTRTTPGEGEKYERRVGDPTDAE